MDKQASEELLRIRILVVDDDAFTRKIVRRVLSDLGYADLSEMASAESALALLQEQSFDLIITDVQMPGINGLELVRRIRTGQTGAVAESRVMVLTSFANTEVLGVAIALAMGERAVVKPAISYHSINTDLRTVQAPPQLEPDRPSADASRPRTAEAERTTPKRRVSLAQLQPGMVLGQRVVAADGALLLSVGHLLSRLNINRLLDLRSILSDEFLWIVEAAEGTPPA